MRLRQRFVMRMAGAVALALTVAAAAPRAAADSNARLQTARVAISGTSNVHPYTAETSAVRVTRLQLREGAEWARWDALTDPGVLEAFDISIAAASLSSPKGDGLNKNMHKALKATEYADITFRLKRLESQPGAPGALRAVGLLQIAGVEREIALDVVAQQASGAISIKGDAHLLMTDFGITPPKAMLGMLTTDPHVAVHFETVVAVPLT